MDGLPVQDPSVSSSMMPYQGNCMVGNLEESHLSFLTPFELKVFKKFVKNYCAKPTLTREDASALKFAFGSCIQHVFELMEEDKVVIYQSLRTKRVVVEVDRNWIPPGYAECPCIEEGNKKGHHCNLILAAHVFLAISPKEIYRNITEEQLNKILYNVLGTKAAEP